MALVIADRVRETSTTTGTGTLTLAGAVSGFQTFSTAIGNTNTCYYTIVNGSEWEVGLGTVAAGTLARTTVLKSSNAGAAVDFSAGTKDVFGTYPADKSVLASSEKTLGGIGYGDGTSIAFTTAGTSGQVLTSTGDGAPTWSGSPLGSDLRYVDYSLVLSSAIASTANANVRMQSVSLDGTSELMILHGTASAHAVIFNTSTNTFGSPILIRTANLGNAQQIALTKISSTSVLVCSLPASSTALETVVLTISGSTITVGTALATTLGAASTLIAANTRLVTVGSSYVLNYFTNSNSLPKFRAITVSGSTPSIGIELAYAGGTTAAMHHSYAQSSSILLHFSITSATTLFVLPITVVGTTLTAGTAATVTVTGAASFSTGALSNGRFALYYLNTSGRGAVVSVAGSVASISTAATTMTTTSASGFMQVFGNQAFVLTGTGGSEVINVITDTGGTATLGTSLAVPTSGSFVGYLSTGKVFFASTTAGNSPYYQYGISSNSPVLEKQFPNVTSTSVVTAEIPASYSIPLAGLPRSESGNTPISLRTSEGKTASSNTLTPFVVSIDGSNSAKLQLSVNPFTSYNDGISEATVWGTVNTQSATSTTIQLKEVTLV